MIVSLVYVSSGTRNFSREELTDMLNSFRRSNQACGISGMMLYERGNIMQVLEGPGEAVDPLFERIKADPRHAGVVRLIRQQIPERAFPDWSMGFRDLTGLGAADLPGYSDFLNEPLDSPGFKLDPSRARRLLDVFRRTRP